VKGDVIALISTITSIAGFFLGLATTRWGRNLIADISRSLAYPFLGVRLIRMGIYDFFDSRLTLVRRKKTTHIIEYLRPATSEIGIIALSLNYSIIHQNLHEELRKLLKTKPKLQIYIFLLDPDSSIVESVATASARSPQELREYIYQSLSRLKRMAATFSEDEKQRFHVCLYDTYVANSILVVDPYHKRGRILVENYLYKVPIQARYSFECRRPNSPMFEKVRIAYERFKEDYFNETCFPKDLPE